MNEETKSKLEQEINDGFHKLIEEHPDIFPKPGPGYIAFKKELASWFKDHPVPDVTEDIQGEKQSEKPEILKLHEKITGELLES